MEILSSKGKLRWAVNVANGAKIPDLEQIETFIRVPWVLYDFAPDGKVSRVINSPVGGWPAFVLDLAENFQRMLETAAQRMQLTSPKPTKRPPSAAVFDPKLARYVERQSFQQLTLPTLLLDKLYDLILEHGHLLGHCQAPAKMKRGPRPKGVKRRQPEGKCGKLFLGKKIDQLYCDRTCAARAAGHRKRPKANQVKAK